MAGAKVWINFGWDSASHIERLISEDAINGEVLLRPEDTGLSVLLSDHGSSASCDESDICESSSAHSNLQSCK